MKRLSWKYIAGLIDSVGIFEMRQKHHKDYPKQPFIVPAVRMAIDISAVEVPTLLYGNHGGELERKETPSDWTDLVLWELRGKSLRPFLQNIVKHLIVKREQAKLSIWVIDHFAGKRVSEQMRERLNDELREMKRNPHRLSEAAAQSILCADATVGPAATPVGSLVGQHADELLRGQPRNGHL